MIAADTNVIVRFVTGDDPIHSPTARQFVSATELHIGVTVVLETAWVLSKAYGMAPMQVASALEHFLGLPGVATEAADEVQRALRWAAEGMDVADALHLSLTKELAPFATLDRRLQRQGRERGCHMVEP